MPHHPILTDNPTILTLYTLMRASDRTSDTSRFWNHFLSKFIFPEENWVIAAEVPPGDNSGREFITIRFFSHYRFTVMCYIAYEKPHALGIEIEKLEADIAAVCNRYCDTTDQTFVHGLAIVGSQVRMKTWYNNGLRQRMIAELSALETNDMADYVAIDGKHGTELVERLQAMKTVPPRHMAN